jgi:hypothetical protein
LKQRPSVADDLISLRGPWNWRYLPSHNYDFELRMNEMWRPREFKLEQGLDGEAWGSWAVSSGRKGNLGPGGPVFTKI